MWKTLHNRVPQWRGMLGPHVKGIIQSTSAQAFNIFGILAGSILAGSYGVFSRYPWALLVFPGLLSNRGAIGGLLSGRLSTGLHLGTILPSVRENTGDAYQLFSAVITLTGLSALFIWFGGGLFSVLSHGTGLRELYQLFLVIFSTLALSIMVVTPITFLVSIQAYNRGFDPDMVVYPITSTTADISISVIYVLILRIVSWGHPVGKTALLLVALVFAAAASAVHVRNREKPEYSKTIREFIGTLVVVTAIVTLTGHMLGRIGEKIGNTPEVYAVYPAMIDTVGDVGSIIGSTATTKLSLGFFEAEFSSIRGHLNEISYAWIGSLTLFTVYALISGSAYGSSNLPSLLAVAWLTNLLVIPLIAIVSFGVGIITYKKGLNPDNFVIPFETSLADGITTGVLYLMIRAWF